MLANAHSAIINFDRTKHKVPHCQTPKLRLISRCKGYFGMPGIASDMAKLVRMLCAIALFCIGFAHKAPAIEPATPFLEIAAYTLPDGTLPVLCLTSEDEHGSHHRADFGNGCEACRISASIALPVPADTIGQPIVLATEIQLPIRREAFYSQLFPPNASPRGPPAGFIV